MAGTNLAIGNTMIAAMRHCSAPDTIFWTPTSSTGSGASTRSSISFVYPNSCTIGRATAWMPWNMITEASTPAISMVENWLAPALPPMPCPIFGKT